MKDLLCSYIAIDTSEGEQQAYYACVELFLNYANADGLTSQVIALPSGYPVLIITLEAKDQALKPLALNHHMDVVPATASEWRVGPFNGVVQDQRIIGRGTQDMKGVGVVHYAALSALKKSGIVPQRTIHIFMVPDEERGGFLGTKQFIEHPAYKYYAPGYVLDEGLASGNDAHLFIKIGERTPLQIQITSIGKNAHGSSLVSPNAAYELVRFLYDLYQLHAKQQKNASQQTAGLLCSYQVTSLQAGCSNILNVIPSKASATVDIRIPLQMEYSHITEQLDELCIKYNSIAYKILATSTERMKIAPTDTLFYHSLAQAIKKSGYHAKPLYFEATTDSRFYSHYGSETLGLTPFAIKPALHEVNESIRLEDLEIGYAIIYDFLKKFCC